MKRVLLFTVCCLFLMQSAALAADKIGVLSMQEIIAKSEYGKEVNSKMEAKFGPRKSQLEKEAASIQQLGTQLQSGAIDKTKLQDKKIELARRERDLKEDMKIFQNKAQIEQRKLAAPLLKKVEAAVMKYATDNNYTIIIEKQTPGIAFIADGVDISDAIIAELNNMKKAGK